MTRYRVVVLSMFTIDGFTAHARYQQRRLPPCPPGHCLGALKILKQNTCIGRPQQMWIDSSVGRAPAHKCGVRRFKFHSSQFCHCSTQKVENLPCLFLSLVVYYLIFKINTCLPLKVTNGNCQRPVFSLKLKPCNFEA